MKKIKKLIQIIQKLLNDGVGQLIQDLVDLRFRQMKKFQIAKKKKRVLKVKTSFLEMINEI